MGAFNQVLLMGNLTRDPQMKSIPSGTQVCEFGMAVNRKWKSAEGEPREEVTFVDCAAFGRTAEVIGQHFTKGKPIFVNGRLKLDQWEKDGEKRSKLSVVVEGFQFIDQREDGGTASNYGQQQRKQSPARPQRQEQQQFAGDDVPF